MSVSSSVRGVTPFVGDGTTATFAFTFKVTGTGDLLVQSELVSTGVFTTLALATDYTVTLNANQELSPGGSITLVAGNLASGRKLYIQSALSGTQGASLKSYGGYSPKVVEAALDRGSMYALDTRAIANRAVLSPLGESGIALPSSTARASKMFAFDGSGNVDVSRSLSAFDSSVSAAATSAYNAATSASNAANSAASSSIAAVSASTAAVSASTAAVSASTAAALVSGSFRTLASFGAVQDGVSGTDDASALNTALASGAVFIDGGNRVSRIGSALTFNASNTILRNFTLAPNQRTESSVFTAGALTLGTVTTLTASVALGASTLNLASLSGIVAGDLIRVTSQQPNAILRDRGGAVHGHTAKVTGVSGNQVFLAKALPWSIVAAESVTSITVSGGVATVTTAAAHGITSAKATIGEWPDIVIAGATGGDAAEYNKTQRITSVPTTTTFTFNTTAAAGATGTLTWSHTHTVQRLTGQVKNSTLQFDVDGAALNPSYAIASVTRGATTTFNAPGHDIAVGNVVIFQGPAPVTPGGTDNCTALRGATGTVTAVSGDNITTDINSTSFTDYTVANSARIVRRCGIVIALENIENCRVHINYRNGTGCGAAVRVGSSYDSDITITTDGMGTAFHPDAWFSYCTGGTHVAKSARAAGFGPQWADTSFVTVVGPESSSADHGRALKFSRFCRNTVIGGNGVNPRFNCVALAWGSRDNTFVGVNAFGSQRVSAQNGGIWSSDGDNTNNTLIGCNAEGNTTSDLSINGDSGWVIIGGNYGVISLSGIASSTTTLMTKKRFEMPQLASMILTGNNVVKLRDVNGFPLAIYGSNGAGGIDDTKPVYWGNNSGAGAIWSVDGFKAQWQAGAAPSEQTSMVLLYQSGGVQKYSRVLLGPDNGGFKELRVAT